MANGETTENGLPQRAQTTNPDWNMYEPRGHGRTDEQIRADIHERIARESGERTQGLSLQVTQGVVTLSGGASSQAERQRLVALVRSVPSVREVRDQLRIEAHPSGSVAQGVQMVRERALEGAHAVQNGAAQLGARAQEYVGSVGERAHDYVDRVSERAHHYAGRAQHYALQTSERTAVGAREVGGFVSTHAFPLALVGASLAYLAWSVQRERERELELRPTTVYPPYPPYTISPVVR